MDKFTHMHTHKHTYTQTPIHAQTYTHTLIHMHVHIHFLQRESLQNMLPAHLGLGVVKQRAEQLAFIENKSKEKFCEKLVEII